MTLVGTFSGPYFAGLLFNVSGTYVRSLVAESCNLVIPYALTMWAASLPPLRDALVSGQDSTTFQSTLPAER